MRVRGCLFEQLKHIDISFRIPRKALLKMFFYRWG